MATVEEFQKQLSDLKTRSQTKIKTLTQLADELHDQHGFQVVQLLNEEIKEAEMGRIQALWSLIDSILKKISKQYKLYIGQTIGICFGICLQRADPENAEWLSKMVTLSWKKHNLLEMDVIDDLEYRISTTTVPAGVPPPVMQSDWPGAPPPVQPMQQVPEPYGHPPAYPQGGVQPFIPVPPPGMDPAGMPPYPVASSSGPYTSSGYHHQESAPYAQDNQQTHHGDNLGDERKLLLLRKMIETKTITPEEISEIMEVPEIRAAVELQQMGKREEALEILHRYKRQVEDKPSAKRRRVEEMQQQGQFSGYDQSHTESQYPQSHTEPSYPPEPPAYPLPELPHVPQSEIQYPMSRSDPPQYPVLPAMTVQYPHTSDTGMPPVEAQPADPYTNQYQGGYYPDVAYPQVEGTAVTPWKPANVKTELTQESYAQAEARADVGRVKEEYEVAKQKKVEEDLRKEEEARKDEPQVGFCRHWVREFMAKLGQYRAYQSHSTGRRVVVSQSDQVAYVDELDPNEILMLLHYIYLIEEHLSKTITMDADLSTRIPATFSQLQFMLDPPSYGLIKAYFDEYPYQCSTCGRRFNAQTALSQHHDMHFKRNSSIEKGLSQGWMDSITQWCGKDVRLGPQTQHQMDTNVPNQPGRLRETTTKPTDRDDIPMENLIPQKMDEKIIVESVPYNEVQPICPTCGEEFEIEWNTQLSDWGCTNAVALDPGTHEKIDFSVHAAADGGSARRIGDAVIYHRLCA